MHAATVNGARNLLQYSMTVAVRETPLREHDLTGRYEF